MISRGAVATVALQGDYGKPRPAVVLQTDLMVGLGSVIVCAIETDLTQAAPRHAAAAGDTAVSEP